MKKDNHIVFEGKSKKGTDIIIRYPRMSNLKNLWKYVNRLSKEKTFVMYQGEKISLREEKRWLKNSLEKIKNRQEVGLFVFVGDRIIGMCGIRLGKRVQKHIGNLGISTDKEYRGEGIGRILLNETIKEAKKRLKELKIITLEIFEINTVAKKLYKELGFKRYGFLPKCLIYKGKCVGEISMYKKIK